VNLSVLYFESLEVRSLEYRLNYLLYQSLKVRIVMLTLTFMYRCLYSDYGCHPKQVQFSGKMFCLYLGSTWFKSFLLFVMCLLMITICNSLSVKVFI
jgi:hypothetical protein